MTSDLLLEVELGNASQAYRGQRKGKGTGEGRRGVSEQVVLGHFLPRI